MRRLFATTAAALAFTASTALAHVVVVYDAQLGDKFEAKREIVDMVKATYGPTAVYDDSDTLPEGLAGELVPRQKLPASQAVEPVPGPLAGKLPHTEFGTHWHKVGDHLVEVTDDSTIVMVVYDVLR